MIPAIPRALSRLILAIMVVLSPLSRADTLVLSPTDDSTLRSTASGNLGSSAILFAGDTATANDFLRSALAFDLDQPVLDGGSSNFSQAPGKKQPVTGRPQRPLLLTRHPRTRRHRGHPGTNDLPRPRALVKGRIEAIDDPNCTL